jgi:hemolysin activation/secretion protein
VLAGDRRDDYGITNFNASVSVDQVIFEDDAARIADRLGANTQGSGTHYDLTLARLQQLDRSNGLYLAFTGQLAGKNLDPADQFSLGGPSNVRGYDVGAVTGADGNVLTAEWRHAFPLPWTGGWLGSLFADRGHIQVYKSTFTPGTNSATLSDAGASLHWDGPQEWAVTAQVAARLGPSPSLLHAGSRESAWLQVQKGL